MRVLLQSRTTLFSVPGGDTIQVQKTAEHLRRLGIDAEVSVELTPPLSGIDLVHVFNATRPQDVFPQMVNARRQGVPIALSPIYVDLREFERVGAPRSRRVLSRMFGSWALEYIKVAARAVKNGEWHRGTSTVLLRGYGPLFSHVCRMADILLPNSNSELDRLQQTIGFVSQPAVVVPNGVDTELFKHREGTRRKYVLCVGRIEPCKNQLRLVKAVNRLRYPTVIVGSPAPNHRRYAARVRREARKNVRFAGYVPYERLPRVYASGRVHVLPSWMETTGLSSLEAAVSGCKIVVGDRGDVRDYFSDLAAYCDPGSVDSIQSAIADAWGARLDTGLEDRIRTLFTWQRCAEITARAYENVIRGRP